MGEPALMARVKVGDKVADGYLVEDIDDGATWWISSTAWAQNWTRPNEGREYWTYDDELLIYADDKVDVENVKLMEFWQMIKACEANLYPKLEFPASPCPNNYSMTDVMDWSDFRELSTFREFAIVSTEMGNDVEEAAKRLALALAILTYGTEVVGY